jgi:UDP-N-acetyl-D-mannosaminuronic acid dehydrogenase
MGYVGIPMAAVLADVSGFSVTGIQRRSPRSAWKIDLLNQGKSPFAGDEPGLAELLARIVNQGTFSVTSDFSVIREADYVLINVQTPADGSDNEPQYREITAAAQDIGAHLKRDTAVILESTVAPGTTLNVVRPILEKASGLTAGEDFALAYSYERLMPGHLIDYIINLPRIVGGINAVSEAKARQLYAAVVKSDILTTDILSAETAKTMENAYRDVNIAFANEMALICESLGIDVWEVRRLVNSRPQRDMHLPGPGVGGHCLPKDSWLLRYGVKTYGTNELADVEEETRLLVLARTINRAMPEHMVRLVYKALAHHAMALGKARLAILGVSYLENSDDVRNSPAYDLIRELEPSGAQIIAHDPYVKEFPQAKFTRGLKEVVSGADVLVIVTKHREYEQLDLAWARSIMRTPIIVDGRDTFSQHLAQEHGFFYLGLGKG